MSKRKSWAPSTTPGGEPARFERAEAVIRWRLDNLVAIWNACVPVGTHVTYYPVADEPMKFVQTCTRSEAWVMGSTMVIMIDGVSGCVACDHLRPRPKPFLPDEAPETEDSP
jgi:hypothetical protein